MNFESDIVFQHLKTWLLRNTPNTAIRRIPVLHAALASDIGYKRIKNEDRVAIIKGQDFNGDEYTIAALSDGMGGMIDGEKCAAITLAAFFSTVLKESSLVGMANDWLQKAAYAANNEIYKHYKGKGGATLSAALIRPTGRVHWINIGDSRIFFKESEDFTQVTVDDTLSGQLGSHSPTFSSRNDLLQFVGIGPSLEAYTKRAVLHENALVILSSDGVHYLGNEMLQNIITIAEEPGTAVKRLIDVSKYASGHDNCSIAIIKVGTKQREIENNISRQYEVWDPSGELQILTIQQSQPIEPENIINTKYTETPPPTKRITRTKKTNKKISAKSHKEKDLLGDEIDADASAATDKENPKFRILFTKE